MLQWCRLGLCSDDCSLDFFHRFAVSVLVLKQVSVEVERHGDARVSEHSLNALRRPPEIRDWKTGLEPPVM
jgi:hypothetical protein